MLLMFFFFFQTECPEENIDNRSLFDRLEEQKLKKKEEEEEKFRLSMSFWSSNSKQ